MTDACYLVAGLGQTGRSIVDYLIRRGHRFVLFDTRTDWDGLAAFREQFPDAACYLGDIPDTLYQTLTGVIVSPGLSLEHPVIAKLREQAIPIMGDLTCFAQSVQAPVVAITGTNGKSTVTTLVGEMAKAAGLRVAVAGNIGTPMLDVLDDGTPYDLFVLELSSFQLETCTTLQPQAATILNVTEDHIDRHHTFSAYCAAKHNVYIGAKTAVYNRDDVYTKPSIPCDNITHYGLSQPDEDTWGMLEDNGLTYLCRGQTRLLSTDELVLKGQHNWQNALAACALADAVGIPTSAMVNVLTHFQGLPHRCTWVRTLSEIDFINDSKGTNVGATLSAISGLGPTIRGKIILIAGGLGKGADFNVLKPAVLQYVRAVMLMGADADKIEVALPDVLTYRVNTLQDAVIGARRIAKAGDMVLLSPACASFDMFRDFEHRGNVFVEAVGAL